MDAEPVGPSQPSKALDAGRHNCNGKLFWLRDQEGEARHQQILEPKGAYPVPGSLMQPKVPHPDPLTLCDQIGQGLWSEI
jgi:hypothetical protein